MTEPTLGDHAEKLLKAAGRITRWDEIDAICALVLAASALARAHGLPLEDWDEICALAWKDMHDDAALALTTQLRREVEARRIAPASTKRRPMRGGGALTKRIES